MIKTIHYYFLFTITTWELIDSPGCTLAHIIITFLFGKEAIPSSEKSDISIYGTKIPLKDLQS